MTTPDRITEILEEMDRNPELASALQARILGSEIPQAVSQNQEQVLKIMEMQLKLASAMRENFGAVAGAIDNISSMVSDSITALAERMDRLETRVDQRMDRLETRIDQLETRVDQRMDRLENGISDMKGFYTEQKTAQQAEIITSDLNLQWVRILTPGELNRLALGEAGGQALTDELRSFREADLVIEARDEEGNTQYLAAEVSFTGAVRDTERALRNAELLTRITGHPARAVVASVTNDREAQREIEDKDIHWHHVAG
jgi:tetrahydromethanopterin S-methyltransferase subunit B